MAVLATDTITLTPEDLTARIGDPELKPRDPATWVGAPLRFPYADGYAHYVIVDVVPGLDPDNDTDTAAVTLVHVRIGDGWSIPDAHIRGITASDVSEQLRREIGLHWLFLDRQDRV